MSSAKPKIFPLKDRQIDAVEPENHIWLSASAGTGKTQVLTARVFRLLLTEQVDPEHILCLTFTKAGAAEMAERINRQLAAWVRMDDTSLASDLAAIGASTGPETRNRARTLFARVLDAQGGGLRIMTIHGFCQSLLASFPEEAGIASMFKPIEQRDQKILARDALGDLLLEEEHSGRPEIIQAIQQLSVRMGEEATEQFLMDCAAKADAMEGLPSGVLPFARDHPAARCDGGIWRQEGTGAAAGDPTLAEPEAGGAGGCPAGCPSRLGNQDHRRAAQGDQGLAESPAGL